MLFKGAHNYIIIMALRRRYGLLVSSYIFWHLWTIIPHFLKQQHGHFISSQAPKDQNLMLISIALRPSIKTRKFNLIPNVYCSQHCIYSYKLHSHQSIVHVTVNFYLKCLLSHIVNSAMSLCHFLHCLNRLALNCLVLILLTHHT